MVYDLAHHFVTISCYKLMAPSARDINKSKHEYRQMRAYNFNYLLLYGKLKASPNKIFIQMNGDFTEILIELLFRESFLRTKMTLVSTKLITS
jgi:hypothetical protein